MSRGARYQWLAYKLLSEPGEEVRGGDSRRGGGFFDNIEALGRQVGPRQALMGSAARVCLAEVAHLCQSHSHLALQQILRGHCASDYSWCKKVGNRESETKSPGAAGSK